MKAQMIRISTGWLVGIVLSMSIVVHAQETVRGRVPSDGKGLWVSDNICTDVQPYGTIEKEVELEAKNGKLSLALVLIRETDAVKHPEDSALAFYWWYSVLAWISSPNGRGNSVEMLDNAVNSFDILGGRAPGVGRKCKVEYSIQRVKLLLDYCKGPDEGLIPVSTTLESLRPEDYKVGYVDAALLSCSGRDVDLRRALVEANVILSNFRTKSIPKVYGLLGSIYYDMWCRNEGARSGQMSIYYYGLYAKSVPKTDPWRQSALNWMNLIRTADKSGMGRTSR